MLDGKHGGHLVFGTRVSLVGYNDVKLSSNQREKCPRQRGMRDGIPIVLRQIKVFRLFQDLS